MFFEATQDSRETKRWQMPMLAGSTGRMDAGDATQNEDCGASIGKGVSSL
jgi:hypothetical protein